MNYLCSECSIQLSKFEVELNELYPIGKMYCEFCQNKKEREIIKKLVESESDPNDQVQVVEDKVYLEKEFTEDLLGGNKNETD
tara:strand:- start:33 stop:281 length:249 start_codon:yes stop_codon:yes gene_type:complete